MKTTSCNESRAHNAEVLESVVNPRETVVITRAGRCPVVMASLGDYKSARGAAHLLRSPEFVGPR